MSMMSSARVKSRIWPVPTDIPARRNRRANRTTFSRIRSKSRSVLSGAFGSISCTGQLHHRTDVASPNLLNIVLVLQERAKGVDDQILVERRRAQSCQGASPIEGLGDSGQFVEILLPK